MVRRGYAPYHQPSREPRPRAGGSDHRWRLRPKITTVAPAMAIIARLLGSGTAAETPESLTLSRPGLSINPVVYSPRMKRPDRFPRTLPKSAAVASAPLEVPTRHSPEGTKSRLTLIHDGPGTTSGLLFQSRVSPLPIKMT